MGEKANEMNSTMVQLWFNCGSIETTMMNHCSNETLVTKLFLSKLNKNGFNKRFTTQSFEEWVLSKFVETLATRKVVGK